MPMTPPLRPTARIMSSVMFRGTSESARQLEWEAMTGFDVTASVS